MLQQALFHVLHSRLSAAATDCCARALVGLGCNSVDSVLNETGLRTRFFFLAADLRGAGALCNIYYDYRRKFFFGTTS